MLADVAISLASRVAEIAVNGQMSNGHGGDGPAATHKAEQMVLLGHGNQLSASRDRRPENFHEERERILKQAYYKAENIIGSNMEALVALADLLEEEKTVKGDDIHDLLDSYE
jgi:ATP-dependent Zn protease